MKKEGIKLALAALLTVFVRLIFELAIPQSKYGDLMDYFAPSDLSQSNLFPLVFILYAWIGYFILGLLTARLTKVSGYLASFLIICMLALIWIIYLLEPLPQIDYSNFFKENFFVAFKYQLADSLSLIFLGWLIHRLLPMDNKRMSLPYSEKDNNLWAKYSLAFAIYFFTVYCLRLVLNNTEFVFNDFHDKQLPTILWTVITCGVNFFIYWYLSGKSSLKYSKQAFILLIFNILFFNFFMILIVKVDPMDLLFRSFSDYLPLLWLNVIDKMGRNSHTINN